MIRRQLIGLLSMAALALLMAPAEAGGGGGVKRSVTIKTSNAAATQICVFGLTEAQLAAGTVPTSVQDAQRNFGGVLIGPGQTKNVSVPGGKGALAAFSVANPALQGGTGYNLGAGSSTTALVADAPGGLDVVIPRPF
jgi:hypothetical protein